MNVTRRSFMQIVAGTGATFALGSFSASACANPTSEKGNEEAVPGTALNAFVQIEADGTVTLTAPRPDMGQGVRTSLTMLVAEELDADWTKVKVVQAQGDGSKFGGQGVGGSGSVRGSNRNLRNIGATARAMLVTAAAQKWGVDASACKTENGKVYGPDGKSAGYGELAAEAAKVPVPQGVPLKDKANFKIIGKATNRVDNTDVVTGKAMFGIDVRVDGMVYAVCLRPPSFGASPGKIDDAAARKVAGVIDIFPIPSGIAIIGKNTWACIKARKILEVEWQTKNDGVSTATLRAALKAAATDHNSMPAGKSITANFELPYLAHATMEVFNAVADVREDRATVWTGTQSPDSCQSMVARSTGLQKEQVTVNTMLMGGGFGRKFSNEWVAEAVELSKRLKKPVKLLWTRECDVTHDTYRPMSEHVMKAAVDASGVPVGWSHQYLQAPGRGGGDYQGNTYLNYNFSNAGMRSGGIGTPVPTGAWRSVEHSQICVVNECFVDELAKLSGVDPFKFRMTYVKSERLKKVLESCAAKADWGKPLPKGVGRGIACFEGYGSCCAHVVEVQVKDNMIKVLRMTAVVDPGTAVNPKGIEAQIQGAFMDGLSTALKAAITIDKGGTAEDNFDGYDWARISDTPKMKVYVEESGANFGGMGEVGYPSAPAAIANAIASATGKRARKFPIKLDELV